MLVFVNISGKGGSLTDFHTPDRHLEVTFEVDIQRFGVFLLGTSVRCLSLSVQNEVCFYIHLPKEESFSELSLNLNPRPDFTASLEPVVVHYLSMM